MTLDQSLANLQHQADRLAGHFSAIADRIEAGGHPYVGADPVAAYAKGVSDAMKPQVATGPVEVMARGDHWDPTREYRDGPNGVELVPTAAEAAVLANPHVSEAIEQTFAGTAETVQVDWRNQTPQGASPSSAPPVATSTASAVEVEGQGVGAPEAPRPAAPNPFETAAPAAAPSGEKKKGRRTHEELAADAGVNLADVKRWLGDKKVTKAAIEEFAALPRTAAPQAPAAPLPQAVSDPFGNTGAPTPGLAPVQNSTGVAEQVVTQPPPTPQPAPTQQWPTGPDGQPLPVSQPVAQAQAAVAPTPDNLFGQTQGAANPWEGQGQEPITNWDPFSG